MASWTKNEGVLFLAALACTRAVVVTASRGWRETVRQALPVAAGVAPFVLVGTLRGGPRPAFRYRDPGNMATIGRARAVADFGRVRVRGWPAWVLWLVIHVIHLAGFRNRLVVLVQWAFSYVTYQRSIRLITGEERAPRPS